MKRVWLGFSLFGLPWLCCGAGVIVGAALAGANPPLGGAFGGMVGFGLGLMASLVSASAWTMFAWIGRAWRPDLRPILWFAGIGAVLGLAAGELLAAVMFGVLGAGFGLVVSIAFFRGRQHAEPGAAAAGGE